ncbi:MAG TPA: hypothetical protein VHW66_19150 [Stellaceae bacterium]|jgi:hypothetical protein|nr:hypothetical protein [Stellaceae bacterium]
MTRDEIVAREFEHVRCRTVSQRQKPVRRLRLVLTAAGVPDGDRHWPVDEGAMVDLAREVA